MVLVKGDSISGLGTVRRITLLTGGCFHGMSALLEAIGLGLYNQIPGDGGELVVSDPAAVKIHAENGRSICGVDINPFIAALRSGKGVAAFYTDDASCSTSMIRNCQKALEAESQTLLIEEVSSITNFLVCDANMQTLIRTEPIKSLMSKRRALVSDYRASTIMAVGGPGD